MYLVKSPYPIDKLSKKWIQWEVRDCKKSIFLTFDDGPIPEVTPQVLRLLKTYNAKATFFMVGENVHRYPEVFKQVVADGHALGNHSYNHLKGFGSKDFTYYRNILKASKSIDSKLFRPPHGQIKPKQLKSIAKHYRVVMWSVLAGDFDKNTGVQTCINNVLKNTKNGSIVVMHDSLKAQENMLPALEACLAYFSERGFQFKSLGQGK